MDERVTEKATPGTPAPAVIRGLFWSLTYRNGKRAQDYDFTLEGTHDEAIEAGRKYCNLRKLSFLNVSPYFESINESNEFYSNQQRGEGLKDRIPGVCY